MRLQPRPSGSDRTAVGVPDASCSKAKAIYIPDVKAIRSTPFRRRRDWALPYTFLAFRCCARDDDRRPRLSPAMRFSPFTDKQIELVTTFADQAVIAIENVRLLDELRQRTDELGRSVEELRALGEVSQAVNSTLDLETVLSTIVGRAVQLSRTDAGAIYVFDDERREFRLHATYGMSETMIAAHHGSAYRPRRCEHWAGR